MKFLNDEHKMRFLELMELDGTNPRDIERTSLFLIVSGNRSLFSKKKSIYNFKERCINLDVFEEGHCSSEKALIRLAFNLFNSFKDDNSSVMDIFYNLDENNRKLALTAIEHRFC